jgi:hypothetical protein
LLSALSEATKKDLRARHTLFQGLSKAEKEELLSMSTKKSAGKDKKEKEEETDSEDEDF